MKTIFTNLFLLILLFTGFQNTHGVNITGKITGKIPKEVFYSVPVNGAAYGGFREAVRTDSSGNFQIKLNIPEPAFVIFTIPGISSRKIIVEPADDYRISIDTDKESGSIKVFGPNEAGQNLYNTLPNPAFVQLEARKFLKEDSIDSIKSKISALKSRDISMFKELLAKGEISESFFKLIYVDKNCYYAALTATIPLLNLYKTNPDQLEKFPLELKRLWEDVYADYPLRRADLMHSPWWYEYAKTYVNYREFFSDSFKIQNLKDFHRQGLIHTHNIEESKKYLTGDELEYYNAAYIFIESFQKKFEKEFIKIFEGFKTDFPESKYKKYLEPMITPIVEFHKKANVNFEDNIKFIDNYQKMGSLKEVLSSLKGKKLYVDVWATSCGPCKAEFENKEVLNKLLKSKELEILYISVDKDENESSWKNMIKFYKLEGYHIRASKQLYADLRRIFNQNGSITIPWYILIDENGTIVKKYAKRPSQIQELKNEIGSIMKMSKAS